MKKKQQTKTGIISILMTLVVIGLLLSAGPAQAFIVNLNGFSDENPSRGDLISTIASIVIDSNERVVMESVNLSVNGVEHCLFNPYNASFMSSCVGVDSITVLNSPADLSFGYGYQYGYDYGYGYNYGYSNGNFTYNITLNSSYFDEGINSVQLFVDLGAIHYSSAVRTFNVTTPVEVPIPTTNLTAVLANGSEYNQEWTTQDVAISLERDVEGVTNYLVNGENLVSTSSSTISFNITEYSVVTYWSSNLAGSENPRNFTIRRAVDGPTGIEGSWEFEGDMESATSLTLHGDLNVTAGNSTVSLFDGTVITPSILGQTINLSALSSALIDVASLSGLEGAEGALQFGIPNLGLSFNPAIKIRLYVGSDLNGQTINIYRSTTGNGAWTQAGLVQTSCVVSAGICEFDTTLASYFVAADSLATVSTSPVTSNTGGVCTTQWTCSEWSACENGLQTRTCSYPSNFCSPKTVKPIESMRCTLEEMPVYYGNETDPESEEGLYTLLTGFVVGNLLENPVNMTLAIFILVLIALALWIVVVKRRSAVQKIKKSESN